MAGSPNAELADLLNEMLSVQERLRKHGIAFGAGLPDPPAGQPEASASSSYAPVSAFHGRMGYSANMWLHHFESLRPEDQPPEIRNNAFWVRKFPLNDSGGVALSDLVGDLESVQVLRFISGADPDPRSASASAPSASPAAPHLPADPSPDAFPEPVQTMVWRCRGLCMDCKKACCGKSDEEYDKVKWHKNHRCNYCWTLWKAEHR